MDKNNNDQNTKWAKTVQSSRKIIKSEKTYQFYTLKTFPFAL